MADTPTREPKVLYQGQSWEWRRDDLAGDWPASTYAFEYAFSNASSSFIITAAADGDAFEVDEAPGDTSPRAPGSYQWVLIATATGERFVIERGVVEVKPDPATAVDFRSHARKMVEAIEALLEKKATKDQRRYRLPDGRELERVSFEELRKLYSEYRQMLRAEEKAEKLEKGLATGGRVFVRFKA